MLANNAEYASTQNDLTVRDAGQNTDQITLLRERIKRQERAIETVIAERDQINECCNKQKELIEHLQRKLHNLPALDDGYSCLLYTSPSPRDS